MARTKFIRMPGMHATHAGRTSQVEAAVQAMSSAGPSSVVLHGPHGSGKSCTAAFLAAGALDGRFELAYAFDCTGGLSGEEFLVRICQFLDHNSVGNFQNIALSPIPYSMKVDFIGKVLDKTSLLIILDNFTPCTGFGASNMMSAIKRLSGCPQGGARLLITSTKRLEIEAPHIEIGQMSLDEASAMLSEYPSIGSDQALLGEIHKISGGLPVYMDMIARSADPASLLKSIGSLDDLAGAVAGSLRSEGAESIIAQACGYEKSIAREGIALPEASEDDLEDLLASGLLEELGNNSGFFRVPEIVRRHYRKTMDDAVWRERLKVCATFHEAYSRKEGVIWHALYAHDLYTKAGDDLSASRLALLLYETLLGWGQSDLMEELCIHSLRSATGPLRAATLNYFALMKQGQRKAVEAIGMYRESLSIYEAEDNKPALASTLDYLGRAYQDSGDSDMAMDCLNRATVLYDSLGNLKSLALAYLQIGKIHHNKRELAEALRNYDKCMNLLDEAQDRTASATALHQIGITFLEHKDYRSALKNLVVSLAIYTQLKSPAKTNVTAAIKRIEEAIGAENIKKLNDEVIEELKSRGKEGNA